MLLIILIFCILMWFNYDILVKNCNNIDLKKNIIIYAISITISSLVIWKDLYLLNIVLYMILYLKKETN